MIPRLRSLVYYISHPRQIIERVKYAGLSPLELYATKAMEYDLDRYKKFAGVFSPTTKENLEAQIIHTYHGIEKGLTMPNRRLNFGHDAVLQLVNLIESYISKYGEPVGQTNHAVGVLKAYLEMHKGYDGKEESSFWEKIHNLTDKYPEIKVAYQPHNTSEDFYKFVDADFPHFAYSRHTLRHYCGSVDESEITSAVELAMTAPSACNRQQVRVHCLSDKNLITKVLELQSGNRGFGTDADKVLIITGDLSDVCWIDERYDTYTNCGIFIMNLCYSLFYYKIAHCILNWSICVDPEKDSLLHKIAGIPECEVVAAMITCGRTPDEFDVAVSPRKDVTEILRFH